MKLETLIRDLKPTQITSDSRAVTPGSVFIAIRGTESDGHRHVDEALAKGATLALGEDARPDLAAKYLQVPSSRAALATLAADYYGNPSKNLTVLGVTGTSGKTTVTYLLESIFRAAGKKVGVIGTVNFRFGEKVYPSTHTTPGPVELQKLLQEMKGDGCQVVVMEVSSHALKQNRVGGVAFDGMIFTNLSREHLDFHPDMEDYFDSKALLFTEHVDAAHGFGKKPVSVINADDFYGQKLIQRLEKEYLLEKENLIYKKNLIDKEHLTEAEKSKSFSLSPYGFSLSQIQNLKCDLLGVRGQACGVQFQSPLIGNFNASNVLAALTLASKLGVPPEKIAQGLQSLEYVPGRLQSVPGTKASRAAQIQVLVDYAHKPDALEKVLKTLRALVQGTQDPQSPQDIHHSQSIQNPQPDPKTASHTRLITVFGCGGDRDRTKRPVMGEIATRLSDQVIVTSDNPRTEDPQSIIREITAGIQKQNYLVEPDRRKAIETAIEQAKNGDLILIAGKGHEDYQILGKTKIHFDDREIASEALTRVFKSL